MLTALALKVVAPSNAYNAKGLLKIMQLMMIIQLYFLENEILYGDKAEVPE